MLIHPIVMLLCVIGWQESPPPPPPPPPPVTAPATAPAVPATAPAPAPVSDDIVLREALVIDRVGQYGRTLIHTDAIEAAIIAGTWTPPQVGQAITTPDGTAHTWTAVTANDKNEIAHAALGGGYAHFNVPSTADRIMLLSARGHNLVYVNGEPRAGDPYSLGWLTIPVRLKVGDNSLLFQGSRGQLSAQLTVPRSTALISAGDLTLPDIIAGAPIDLIGGVTLINATEAVIEGLSIGASLNGQPPTVTPLPRLEPLSLRKVMFRVQGPPIESKPPDGPTSAAVRLEVIEQSGDATRSIDAADISLGIAQPDGLQNRTFISEIDGSVQYFALRPAVVPPPKEGEAAPPPPGMLLTLHGAAVEARSQAAAYQSKPWCHIVAPTNRRMFGFDWEDWGRLDAMEVLAVAQRSLPFDPQRVWLTGHSMGGHGTWNLGATFPDRFAALAPSAGWISFASYGGAPKPENPTPMQELLLRATSPSDTLALSRNYLQHGIYILHGDADDNVPVDQARAMRQHLGGYHGNFAYFEKKGAGHWWGNECVDWPPLMDFLQHQQRPAPADISYVQFQTANPGVSSSSDWVSIEAQQQAMKVSAVDLQRDRANRKFAGTTINVARLAIRLRDLEPGAPINVELDGQKLDSLPWPTDGDTLWFEHAGDQWKTVGRPSPAHKGPHRNGSFKDAFRNRVLFVYGTGGTPEENAWAAAKARLDAETFCYRGNGSIEVLPDVLFDPMKDVDRNVILYGHSESNRVWGALLGDSPVQVKRGTVKVGDREIVGEDLATLFIRPRPGSDAGGASVGVVSGSGLVGLKLTDRVPYFVSGVGLPDCLVIGAESLTTGLDGVRAAGFFGHDWSMTGSEFVWKP